MYEKLFSALVVDYGACDSAASIPKRLVQPCSPAPLMEQ
jgi:hypothetical protein